MCRGRARWAGCRFSVECRVSALLALYYACACACRGGKYSGLPGMCLEVSRPVAGLGRRRLACLEAPSYELQSHHRRLCLLGLLYRRGRTS